MYFCALLPDTLPEVESKFRSYRAGGPYAPHPTQIFCQNWIHSIRTGSAGSAVKVALIRVGGSAPAIFVQKLAALGHDVPGQKHRRHAVPIR